MADEGGAVEDIKEDPPVNEAVEEPQQEEVKSGPEEQKDEPIKEEQKVEKSTDVAEGEQKPPLDSVPEPAETEGGTEKEKIEIELPHEENNNEGGNVETNEDQEGNRNEGTQVDPKGDQEIRQEEDTVTNDINVDDQLAVNPESKLEEEKLQPAPEANETAQMPDENVQGEDEDQTAVEVEAEQKEAQPPSERPEVIQEVEQSGEDKEMVSMETETAGDAPEVDPNAKSPSPVNTGPATCTVKFVLMPSGHVSTMACALSVPLETIKQDLADTLRMPADKLIIIYDSAPVDDNNSLEQLGVAVNGAVQLEVASADPINIPIKPPRPQPEYNMPDIITVRIDKDDATSQEIVVEIERSMRHKPFLGGFRNRMTGIEFHNASAQTRSKVRADNGIPKFCRDTQTVSQRNKTQQVTRNTSTQMTTIGCYVSNITDKLLTPGKYTTAYEYHARRLNAVIILQSYFRRWQAKRHVETLKEDMLRRQEWERQEEMRKIREKEERIRMEFERRMNPKTKEDFDLLYHALEKWRKEELEAINNSLTGAKRKAALCHLLDQETQLIAAIGRHKLQADTENKQKSIQNFLNKAAAPRRWKSADGKYTEMDTAYTIRARELKDIYNSLNMKYLTQDERLDALLTLKHTVKEHDCKLTQEIIELIDREADLLMRGTKESNLEGLRKRISTLFLQYIKTPTFNAEAARLLKVPQDPSTLRKNIYFCPSCSSYLPSTEFQLSSNTTGVGRCRRCNKLDNDARERQDFSHYRYMLKALRRSEEAFQDGSRIAFLLQEADLRYLVEEIWSTQSALSAWSDLYDLVLIRWDRDEEWSPWNCILLTKDEATAHFQVEDLEKNYGRVFCHKVKTKHTLSRNYFSRLPGMAEFMRQKSSRNPNTGIMTSKPVATLKA